MKRTFLLLAVFMLIIVINSCQKAEEAIVSQYFQAMKNNDRDTMSAMALEPKDVEFKSYEFLRTNSSGVGT